MIKKIIKIIIPCIAFVLVIACGKKDNKFYLEDELYGKAEFIELNASKLDELIKTKESFAVFIYQPLCETSYEFNEILTTFANENQITLYKISFSEMKETTLSKNIKYYPSFAIYKKGELIDYLDAEKDEDKKYYKVDIEFKNWFTNYVKLKKSNNTNFIDTSTKENEEKIDAVLDNVTYDANKVNIYFFWGDGCPHCEKQFDFLERIEDEYGNYFNLYTFEVWYNEENEKLLKQFANIMGDELKGVPYTIIGEKTFKGFNESFEDDMLDAIKNQYQDSYDVYFSNK